MIHQFRIFSTTCVALTWSCWSWYCTAASCSSLEVFWVYTQKIPIYLLPPVCSWPAHCIVLSQSSRWPSHCTGRYLKSPHNPSCRTWILTCRITDWIHTPLSCNTKAYFHAWGFNSSPFPTDHSLLHPLTPVDLPPHPSTPSTLHSSPSSPIHEGILLFVAGSSESLTDIKCVRHTISSTVCVAPPPTIMNILDHSGSLCGPTPHNNLRPSLVPRPLSEDFIQRLLWQQFAHKHSCINVLGDLCALGLT